MATRSISPGQVVLMEQPVIFISNHEEKAADRREEEVLEQYNTLSRKLKKQMNKLTYSTNIHIVSLHHKILFGWKLLGSNKLSIENTYYFNAFHENFIKM